MKEQFSLRTVRKKVVMISKVAGIILIISYIASTRMPINQDISYLIWIALIILLELAVDFLIGYFISKPISALCRSARKIADLDFSSPCKISSNDVACRAKHKKMTSKTQKPRLKLPINDI